jgi:endonuclease/exonuclease/phosphatase (EEP) superfamily protein YafD
MSNAATLIRRLFLEPRPTYSIAETADLLGMPARDVRGWIEAGEIEPLDTVHGVVLPWSEVVVFGMELWSQETVEAALGEDLAQAIPELLRLTALEVRIPRLEVLTLEHLAARDGKSVDAVLTKELLDLVSANFERLASEIPGFVEAMGWP